MTILGGRTKQLNIFCRVTGFTSDIFSFIVVELIWFFHGAIQLFCIELLMCCVASVDCRLSTCNIFWFVLLYVSMSVCLSSCLYVHLLIDTVWMHECCRTLWVCVCALSGRVQLPGTGVESPAITGSRTSSPAYSLSSDVSWTQSKTFRRIQTLHHSSKVLSLLLYSLCLSVCLSDYLSVSVLL